MFDAEIDDSKSFFAGPVRNIYFPFDIETDTALSVATEMVAELDITDQDVTKIAEMIDGEIASLVPEWKSGVGIEESHNHKTSSCCHNCASDGNSLAGYLSSHISGKNLQCSKHGCGAMHGRFEEITYQFEGSEQSVTDGAPICSSQSNGVDYTDIWEQHQGPEVSSQINDGENIEHSRNDNQERIASIDKEIAPNIQCSPTTNPSATAEDYENEIRQEIRWLKAKYQMQLRKLRDQQLGVVSKPSNLDPYNKERVKSNLPSVSRTPEGEKDDYEPKSFAYGKHFTTVAPMHSKKNQNDDTFESLYDSCSPVHIGTAKNFYSGPLLPHSLHRATSLPVDATDL